jgi:hypothetical protein
MAHRHRHTYRLRFLIPLPGRRSCGVVAIVGVLVSLGIPVTYLA